MRRLATTVVAAALAGGLTGCSPGPGPEETVRHFTEALATEDYAAACTDLDPNFVQILEEARDSKQCPEILEENGRLMSRLVPEDESMDITDSQVSDGGRTATVTVEYEDGSTEDIELVEVKGEWKITFG